MKTLKRRPIEGIKGTLETYQLGASGGMIPRDQERLRKIVLALLWRIRRKNPKEARDLASYIQLLTGQERRFPPYTPEQLAREKGIRLRRMEKFNELALDVTRGFEATALRHIVYGNVPRADHAWDTVGMQRDLLTHYLLIHPFRIRLRRVDSDVGCRDAARQWVTDNGQRIWPLLYDVPCYCEYRESFDELLERKALTNCRGSPRLIDLFLAELHTSTPDAIRRIISHPPVSSPVFPGL